MDKAIKDLTAAIKMEKDGPEPYDTPAEVTRIEGNTAWVHIPGGIDETPVQLTISAEPGDTVQIRVAGGRAWITGNQSAPPTDDKVAKAARTTAAAAEAAAETAAVLSETAKRQAAAAAKIAGDTEQHFWFTETGADTGAHITEKTQEEFLQDPGNGGGNLLARSNGIALRDGLSEKLTITSSDITMGETSGQFLTQEPTGLLFGANTLYKARLQVDQPGIVIEDITTQQELRLGDAAFSFHLGDNSTAIYESSGDLHMIAFDGIIIDTNQGSGGRNITANGNITASGEITAKGHGTPIGYNNTGSGTKNNFPNNSQTEVVGGINVTPGTWLLICRVGFPANTTGRRFACWHNNTTNADYLTSYASSPPVNGGYTNIQTILAIEVTTNTTFAVQAIQNSGGTMNVSYNWSIVRIA